MPLNKETKPKHLYRKIVVVLFNQQTVKEYEADEGFICSCG